jgi:hypothetical protein
MMESERRTTTLFRLRTPLSFHLMEDLPGGEHPPDGLASQQESLERWHRNSRKNSRNKN